MKKVSILQLFSSFGVICTFYVLFVVCGSIAVVIIPNYPRKTKEQKLHGNVTTWSVTDPLNPICGWSSLNRGQNPCSNISG